MTEQQSEGGVPSVKDVLDRFADSVEGDTLDQMRAALIEREDQIADHLRVAGIQLGTFPEFVAKVLADVGLGSPISIEQHQYLNQQFADRLAWLQQQFGNNS